MEVKPGFWDPEVVSLPPEWRCPINRGNKYKDYEDVFPGPNLVSLNGGVPKETFQHITINRFIIIITIIII